MEKKKRMKEMTAEEEEEEDRNTGDEGRWRTSRRRGRTKSEDSSNRAREEAPPLEPVRSRQGTIQNN